MKNSLNNKNSNLIKRLTCLCYFFLSILFLIWMIPVARTLYARDWSLSEWEVLKNTVLDYNPEMVVCIFLAGLIIRFLPLIATILYIALSSAALYFVVLEGINFSTYQGFEEFHFFLWTLLIACALVRRQLLLYRNKSDKET